MRKDEMLEEIAEYENQISEMVNGIERILNKIPDLSDYEERKYRSPEFLGALSRLANLGRGYEAAFGNGPTLMDLTDLVVSYMEDEENDEDGEEMEDIE